MENVVRIKYLEVFNQLGLIGTSVLERWVKNRGTSNVEEIRNKISEYILRVNSVSGNGVVLAGCFTNLNNYYSRSYGCNLMVFPIGDEVSYVLRDDVDYFTNNRGDPRFVSPSLEVYSTVLFFGNDPFDSTKYNDTKVSFLQSESDLESIHSGTRRNLIKTAGARGFGSLDIFVENE